MACQDYQDAFRWVVTTGDPEPYEFRLNQLILHRKAKLAKGVHPLCANLGVALNSITSSLSDEDLILIIEDDDYYSMNYISEMVECLGRADLVGEDNSRYYNVKTNKYKVMSNTNHASLAQTGFRSRVVECAKGACQGGTPFVDKILWARWDGSKEIIGDRGLHVSLKGMPGVRGIGTGHREEFGNQDKDLKVFRRWGIPDVYLKYGKATVPAIPTDLGYPREERGVVGNPAGINGTGNHHPLFSPLIAPLNTPDARPRYAGRIARKTWEYPITAVIPHLNTPEALEWSVRTILGQTVPCYVLVIDTGSDQEAINKLESLRSDNIEIHYIKSHCWKHSSEPVCAAMDMAMGLCKTDFMYCTHSDCFIVRKDWLEWLAGRCGEGNPVVGYQMSPRSHLTSDWVWMVSHTATMLHMPTMLKNGVSWSMERYMHTFPQGGRIGSGWPDTETGFNFLLRAAGIKPEILGPECNHCRDKDDNKDHVRSYPSSTLYGVGSINYGKNKNSWMEEAISGAKARVKKWAEEADMIR